MPVKRRRKKGTAPSAQIRNTGAKGTGPDTYDGRANTNAGTPPEKKLDVEGPAKVIKTH
jgi:hypothetical protein